MKTFTLIVVIIMAALIGLTGYLYLQDNNPDMADNQDTNNQVSQEENESMPDNWQTYSNNNFDFTFLYPAGATQSVENGRAKITVLGSNNTANSEITDGFTFFVRTEDVPEDTSLSEFATSLYEEESEGLEAIQEPTQRMVNGRLMYEFQVETELGTIATHSVFEADEGRVFVATYTIAGPVESIYQNTVDIMLSSIEPQDE